MGVATGVTVKDKKHKYHTTNNLWANRPFFFSFFLQAVIDHTCTAPFRKKQMGHNKGEMGRCRVVTLGL